MVQTSASQSTSGHVAMRASQERHAVATTNAKHNRVEGPACRPVRIGRSRVIAQTRGSSAVDLAAVDRR